MAWSHSELCRAKPLPSFLLTPFLDVLFTRSILSNCKTLSAVDIATFRKLTDLFSRMQCETVQGGLHGNQLIASTAKKMWTTNPLSFFRGLPLGLIGMFPFAAIDLTTFETLKSALVARNARLNRCHEDDVSLDSFSTGAIGAFSGALSASIVYPMNVLRTRLQAQGTVLHTPTYTGVADVTRKTLKAEGVRGLFRGITPNLLKVVPSVSISYVVYENSKKLLDLK